MMISQDIVFQCRIFMMAMMWGACLVWGYDGLRLLRLFVSHNKGVQILEEMIFWVIASFWIFVLLGRYNHGAVRNYVVCGMLLGMVVYRLLISSFFMRISCNIIRIFKTFIFSIVKRLKFITNRVRIVFKNVIRRKG